MTEKNETSLYQLDLELDFMHAALEQAMQQGDSHKVKALKERVSLLKEAMLDVLSAPSLLLDTDPDEFYQAADELLKKHGATPPTTGQEDGS